MFRCGPIYYDNLNSKADIVINQGGTDSGKTYAIIQVIYTIITTERPPKEDPIITVVGESVPNLKKGAYRTAKSILSNTPYLQSQLTKQPNETDRIIQFKNGWILEFNSYENEQQAKQGKRQYLFVNEAQSIKWDVFWQLSKRTRVRTYIDYNPSAPFWAHDKLIGTTPEGNDLFASVERLISDHRHNPFLSQKDHDRTENIKDYERWKVYARGVTGNLSGLIYPNWKQITDSEFPDTDYFWGLDFGYTNDETALTKCAIIGNNLFIHECLYETGAPATRVKAILTVNGYRSDQVVYCDHDKEQVAQLRRLQIVAIQANKGPGSKKGGILKMNEFNVYYTASSKNLHEERIRYMWKIDPNTGEPTNEPVDGFDHCMDSSRMAVYTKFFRQGI